MKTYRKTSKTKSKKNQFQWFVGARINIIITILIIISILSIISIIIGGLGGWRRGGFVNLTRGVNKTPSAPALQEH